MSTTSSNRISLRLRELNQLFNSLDPSPFIDRDLDHNAEEFIVSSAREAHSKRPFELVLQLATPPDPQRAAETEAAVQHYFSVRAELKGREFRRLLRRGHSYFITGLIFLAVCLFLSSTVGNFYSPPFGEILHEGLMIVGWVAMWKPLETYLYDWWPVRKEWLDLQCLARIRVRIVTPQSNPEPASKDAPPEPGITFPTVTRE